MMKPGSRWKSVVCTAEAVVVRPPKSEGVPQCGGLDMVPLDQADAPQGGAIVDGFDGACQVGKRYRGEAAGIEMLCTKAGNGAIGFAGEAPAVIEAKKLPSSD